MSPECVDSSVDDVRKAKKAKVTQCLRRSSRKNFINLSPFPYLQRLFFSPDASNVNGSKGAMRMRRVHSLPNVWVCDNFLKEREILEIESVMGVSRKVVNGKKGWRKSYTDREDKTISSDSTHRRSKFYSFTKLQNKTISTIESRAAEMVGCTIEHVEPLQCVQYTPGDFFKTHHDTGVLYDDGTVELPRGRGRRVVTIFAYLNTLDVDKQGGGTTFPLLVPETEAETEAEAETETTTTTTTEDASTSSTSTSSASPSVSSSSPSPSSPSPPPPTSAPTGLTLKPVRGSAVIWCNVLPDGTCDPRMIHKGDEVTEGVKRGVNLWITD